MRVSLDTNGLSNAANEAIKKAQLLLNEENLEDEEENSEEDEENLDDLFGNDNLDDCEDEEGSEEDDESSEEDDLFDITIKTTINEAEYNIKCQYEMSSNNVEVLDYHIENE